ncbi:MAG: hypothetical protein M3O35_08955 [Acidobacteriota bacterium]|nr:hypothetical protein [Acidobacteriota bacterium]
MRRSTLAIACYLFLIFASGIVVGAFGYRLYSGTPVSAKATLPKMTGDQRRQQYLAEMQDRLKLTPDQNRELNRIVDQSRVLFDDAHRRHDEEVKAIREKHTTAVRAMLTPQQLPEYEKLHAEREQRKAAAQK